MSDQKESFLTRTQQEVTFLQSELAHMDKLKRYFAKEIIPYSMYAHRKLTFHRQKSLLWGTVQ